MTDRKDKCCYIADEEEIINTIGLCDITDWEEHLIEEEIISVTGIPNVSKELCSIGGKNTYRNKIERKDPIGFDGLPLDELKRICSIAGRVKGKGKGLSWWYDGERFVRSSEQPKGFYKHHAPNNPGKKTKDTIWWNNGNKHKRSKTCPGEGWVKGRLSANFGPKPKTRCWWTDGTYSVLSKDCPAKNWRKGRTVKPYK